MILPTWGELENYYCAYSRVKNTTPSVPNPYYEEMATRRYNYSPLPDQSAVSLVFLNGATDSPGHNTLCRSGRFIWCRNLRYEGRHNSGLRQLSLTVDHGKKRFLVAENNVLCIPSQIYISNSRYFRTVAKTFRGFSSVFSYENSVALMRQTTQDDRPTFRDRLSADNPFKPGALVAPRLGYFYPTAGLTAPATQDTPHPCGIVLGRSVMPEFVGREFYRVRFGSTTYERVHPIQMEIINEV